MAKTRSVQQIAADIKALKIQGARRIAKSALEGLMLAAKASRAKNKAGFHSDLLAAARLLEATRPTEPMMRNALEQTLRFSMAWIHANPARDVAALRAALAKREALLLSDMEKSADTIAKIGAAEIPDNASILIHCHSTTLMRLLIRAHKMGKHLRVTCLETRPLYQGRLSARELSAAGIKTTLAVDSACGSLINQIDLVLVGADAITSEGDLINKVGTSTLAQLAHLHSVRFLCAAETWKFDPLTRLGRAEPIEQRAWEEVWGSGLYGQEKGKKVKKPAKLSVLNPAFDRTPARLISAYITEEGLVPPAQLGIIAQSKLSLSR
ncbi:Ribose 1,5-bisphosphate isomerase [uncultured archaeon]|nr:Ribose 1,5-bisphosphate isomerase [uncultured archaeon]